MEADIMLDFGAKQACEMGIRGAKLMMLAEPASGWKTGS